MNSLQVNQKVYRRFSATRIRSDLRKDGDSLCREFQVVLVQSDREPVPNLLGCGTYRVAVFALAVCGSDRNGFDLPAPKVPMQKHQRMIE